MSDVNHPITFPQLLERCPRIEVPLIQRDYAQGRETEKDVRDDLLSALHRALVAPPGDPEVPLNLDFVYGSMEDGDSGSFLPLDGQQRLTTLFLLHWYLAWRDGRNSDFERILRSGQHSRFTYSVRPSSKEFFDELVRYVPNIRPEDASSLKLLLEDQPWFFLHWRLDPTIQSALVMLDAIHDLFKSTAGLFSRLVDGDRPAITFQLLPLKHFGLTDDLYIKMNGRGKPLTHFETFKARFGEVLTELFPTEARKLDGASVNIAVFFERRVDTKWTDFFWAYKSPKTNTFDEAVINLLLGLARISLDPGNENFGEDTTLLRRRQLTGTFSLFHEHGWLTRDFAENLIYLLEAWSSGAGQLQPILPSPRYFDEEAIFEKVIKEPAALDYTQLIQFAALVFYLRHNEDDVQPTNIDEWMRVVRNLATNTSIERPEEYQRCLAGLHKLLPHSGEILVRLSDTDIGAIGFSPVQVREEVLKARLILANSDWRGLIDSAEAHDYFSGQIDFILDFSGVHGEEEKSPEKWEDAVHAEFQLKFNSYLAKARTTFRSTGLVSTNETDEPHLWKRALLTIGDYLLPAGSNYTFLTNPQSDRDNWKRFLRDAHSGKRGYLKTLWDRVDLNDEIEQQLQKMISGASGLDPWRAAIVEHPDIISYCKDQQIRRVDNDEKVYLMKRKQMNGAHAELFSYVLYLELLNAGRYKALAPLRLQDYKSVSMTALEPHLIFVIDIHKHTVQFVVESRNGQFRITASWAKEIELADLEAALCSQAGFFNEAGQLTRVVPRSDIHQGLQELAQQLSNLAD